MNFVHLHLHTSASALDGAMTAKAVATKVKTLGQPAVAITDHGTLSGIISFYNECKKAEVKPIIGLEAYIAPGSRYIKERPKDDPIPPAFHLTLLAMNDNGLRNLFKLSSLSYLEGFYYKPRVDYSLLAEHNTDIICLSGCLSGRFQWSLGRMLETKDLGWKAEAIKDLKKLHEIFGDRLYVELQRIAPIQQEIVHEQALIADELGIPLVATCDCHYLEKDDVDFHAQLLCISTGKTIKDEDRMMGHEGLYIKSTAEMAGLFTDYIEAVSNTAKVASRIQTYTILDKSKNPKFPIFSGSHEEDEKLFIDLAWEGLSRRLLSGRPEYRERLEYELGVIKEMGFPSYFLIVSDYVKWAKTNGIPVGAGRGSAAGSLVAYCLFITEVDPILHGLYFERFLNPARKSLPDIDVDFAPEGRGKLINYLRSKYGFEKVAQISTFACFKPRGAVRDFARVQGLEYELGDRISKMVPPTLRGHDPTWDETIVACPTMLTDPEIAPVVKMARKSDGLIRQRGIHAGGVVIAPCELDQILPRCLGKEDEITTQVDMEEVEYLGLVKMDVLGLKSLTLIEKCIQLVKKSKGLDVDIYKIPTDDPVAFKLLAAGETSGIFQFDGGGGIRDLGIQLQPQTIDEIAAISALYRPGPLDSGLVDIYVKRKTGREPVEYLFPHLETILKPTLGVLVFQEQVMKIAVDLAGYTLAESDDIRKAIGKKIREKLAEHEQKMISGLIKSGVDQSKARAFWEMLVGFADYAFNKAHSVAYSYITYQTAYLKAYYPTEFYCALLDLHTSEKDKMTQYLSDCRRLGIQVLPPDVNYSSIAFDVVNDEIRFGLAGVVGLGDKVASGILYARRSGKFLTLIDFYERTKENKVNKKTLEALAKVGAFESLGLTRAAVLRVIDNLVSREAELDSYERKTITYNKRMEAHNQREEERKLALEAGKKPKASLKLPEKPEEPRPVEVPLTQELSDMEILKNERELLGLYIKGHPLDAFNSGRDARLISTVPGDHSAGNEFETIGIIVVAKTITTKSSNQMCFITVENKLATFEAIVFPAVYKRCAQQLVEGNIVLLEGTVEEKDGQFKVLVRDLIRKEPPTTFAFSEVKGANATLVFDKDPSDEDLSRIGTIVNNCRGNINLLILRNNVILGFNKRISRLGVDQLRKVCNNILMD